MTKATRKASQSTTSPCLGRKRHHHHRKCRFFVFLLMLFECQYIKDEWKQAFRNRPIKPPRDASVKSNFAEILAYFGIQSGKYYLNHEKFYDFAE
jgi:hypothetical protein